jgi:hypothetical protein
MFAPAAVAAAPPPVVPNPIDIGITDTMKPLLKDLLEEFALSDFRHDFGSEKIDEKFLNELASIYDPSMSISQTQFSKNLLAFRTKYLGETIYDFIDNKLFQYSLPSNLIEQEAHADEDKVFNKIWIPALQPTQTIKSLRELRNEILKANPVKKDSYPNTSIPECTIGINKQNGSMHEYNIRSFPSKHNGIYNNLTHTFLQVSDPNTNTFILLIDASCLAMTTLTKGGIVNMMFSQNQKIAYDPLKQYTFYIVSSLENESDPATKLNKLDKVEPYDNIIIFFLKEAPNHVSSFPDWLNGSGFNSTFFSRLPFTTRRNPQTKKIDCTVTIPNGKTIDISDVGTASEIKRASLLAILKFVEYDLNPTEVEWATILLYFMLKRAGDWCQALCLLDRDRIYDIYDITMNPIDQRITMNIILANSVAEIGLVTIDRILLAYALLQGLNVFFSINIPGDGHSCTWLLYFKNIVSTDPNVMQRLIGEKQYEITALLGAAPNQLRIDKLSELLDSAKEQYETIKVILGNYFGANNATNFTIDNLGQFLKNLRILTYIAGSLRSIDQFTIEQFTAYEDANLTDLTTLSSYKAFILDFIEAGNHNIKFLDFLNNHQNVPNIVGIDIEFENITAFMSSLSSEIKQPIVSGMTILSKEYMNYLNTTYEEIKKSIKATELTIPQPSKDDILKEITAYFSPSAENKRQISLLKINLSKSYIRIVEDIMKLYPLNKQGGGGLIDDYIVSDLKNKKIQTRPLNKVEITDATELGIIPFQLNRGTKLLDSYGNLNTVIDDYMIDSSHEPVFKTLFENFDTIEETNKQFVYYRFILYYLDILSGRLDTYRNNDYHRFLKEGDNDEYSIHEEQENYHKLTIYNEITRYFLALEYAFKTPSNSIYDVINNIEPHMNNDIFYVLNEKGDVFVDSNGNRYYKSIDTTIDSIEKDIILLKVKTIFQYYYNENTLIDFQECMKLINTLCPTDSILTGIASFKDTDIHNSTHLEYLLNTRIPILLVRKTMEDSETEHILNYYPKLQGQVYSSSNTKYIKHYANAIQFSASSPYYSSIVPTLLIHAEKYFTENDVLETLKSATVSNDVKLSICIVTLYYYNRDFIDYIIDNFSNNIVEIYANTLKLFYLASLNLFQINLDFYLSKLNDKGNYLLKYTLQTMDIPDPSFRGGQKRKGKTHKHIKYRHVSRKHRKGKGTLKVIKLRQRARKNKTKKKL